MYGPISAIVAVSHAALHRLPRNSGTWSYERYKIDSQGATAGTKVYGASP